MNEQNKVILVVDDEKLNVDLLQEYLPRVGYEVTGVTDPRLALDLINEQNYDLVLTDLVMPGVSGIDIVKEVEKRNTDTKVLIFTAYASIDTAIEAIQHGVYDYIQKPFNLDQIRAVLDRAYDKLRLERENKRLNQKLSHMLSEITMLYEISNLLYQIKDREACLDLVLDTISEGLKIQYSAIFLPENSKFKICRSKGLSEEFQQAFEFRRGDVIAQNEILEEEATIILTDDGTLELNGSPLPGSESICGLVLLPIRYMENLVGFLGIFDSSSQQSQLSDNLKLQNILATQIAPILHSYQESDSDSSRESEQKIRSNDLSRVLSQLNGSSVSVILARVVLAEDSVEAPKISDIRSNAINEFRGEFGAALHILWQHMDTICVLVQGVNPANVQLACSSIERRISENHRSLTQDSSVRMETRIQYELSDQQKSLSEIIDSLEQEFFSRNIR